MKIQVLNHKNMYNKINEDFFNFLNKAFNI